MFVPPALPYHILVCPLEGVSVGLAEGEDTSKSQLFFVCVVIVAIVAGSELSVEFVALFAGKEDWSTPENDAAPITAASGAPLKLTLTVCDPLAGLSNP